MRSKQLDLYQYATDKITSGYLDIYDSILGPWVEEEITLLELGVYNGGSLKLWRDYFPHGSVVGVDIHLPIDFVPGERIRVFQGNQADTQFLSRVAEQTAPQGFDIIIDDASHIGEITRTAFWHLFDHHLVPGGLYVIEDWGTGYWSDWPDGRRFCSRPSLISRTWAKIISRSHFASRLPVKIPLSNHSYGMVGLVKQLIDEQGAADHTRGNLAGIPGHSSKFSRMYIYPSLAFIFKAKPGP